jgi:hypothetical protein
MGEGVFMKIQRIALLAGAVMLGSSALAQNLWYNGDFDTRNGGNCSGFGTFDSRLYDDFNVTGAGWNVNGVFINVLSAVPQADILTFTWEIRSGVTTGSGGTLLFSGSNAATVTTTGRTGFSRPEYNVLVSGLNINLAAGTYWLGGKVGGNGTSNDMFVSTTSGANAIGTPPGNNGNAFWDSVDFAQTWQPATAIFGTGTWDLSMGVTGTPVPEPATFAIVGIGALALLRRRKKA